MNQRLFLLLLCLFLLGACARSFDPRADLLDDSRHFRDALRWQDYIGAGRHMQDDVKQSLMDIFQDNEDLRIVDSSIYRVDVAPEGDRAEIEYRMQYYRLPSMRVQKWHWLQQWQLQPGKGMNQGLWLIVNSPPPLD
ncbi:hypothetical protein SAMN02745165_01889 [Malonomonas rubra DSM 5091]|uniref:Lipoprotein n=2 Tax=Malonomonas rubra TaxID=57040 RepID=A0A1M6HMF7_MALRU|nr:hypothetical protein SAMN02745165_01889 [Malonomonas rubra DSM 5091]